MRPRDRRARCPLCAVTAGQDSVQLVVDGMLQPDPVAITGQAAARCVPTPAGRDPDRSPNRGERGRGRPRRGPPAPPSRRHEPRASRSTAGPISSRQRSTQHGNVRLPLACDPWLATPPTPRRVRLSRGKHDASARRPPQLTMRGFAVHAPEIAGCRRAGGQCAGDPCRCCLEALLGHALSSLARAFAASRPYRQIPYRSLAPGTGEGVSGAGERLEIWRYGLAVLQDCPRLCPQRSLRRQTPCGPHSPPGNTPSSIPANASSLVARYVSHAC